MIEYKFMQKMSDCATLPYEVELEEELGWNTIRDFLHDNMVINLMQVVSNRREISCARYAWRRRLNSRRLGMPSTIRPDVTTRDMPIQK
jgi:hypothetical protein